MVMINLGSISSGKVSPGSAYGVLRSSSLLADAVCMAVQGTAVGLFFGKPHIGAATGVIMSCADKIVHSISQ